MLSIVLVSGFLGCVLGAWDCYYAGVTESLGRGGAFHLPLTPSIEEGRTNLFEGISASDMGYRGLWVSRNRPGALGLSDAVGSYF